ncbi:MAG: hypothetical protein ACRYGP_24565 [Janthinobacterium lividum]
MTDPPSWLDAALPWMLGAAMLAAAALAIWCSLSRMMALDELYTMTLVEAPSLGHMIEGALQGVDGNPPLYLSLGWLLVHALPVSPDSLLRCLNLGLLAATAMMLTRIGRRVADMPSVLIALALLCALDEMVIFALLEVRTYALYLCLLTATIWATLAVVDRPSASRATALATIGLLAAMAHSFGGFYVAATIVPAALFCLTGEDRRPAAVLGVAALPALAVTLVWIFSTLSTQLAVATPYGWIPRPSLATLIQALTGSIPLTLSLLLTLAWFAARGQLAPHLAAWRQTTASPDRAIPSVIVVSFAALTVAGWLGSHIVTSFFVDRYFIPNLAAAALLLIYAVAAARRLAPPRLFAAASALCILSGLAMVAAGSSSTASEMPCVTGEGRFLEDGIDADLPVVIESPHAWLPRNRYAPSRTALYPLDWDVVLNHPHRAPNNAMDFHIMEILKHWAPGGSALATDVLPTAAILSSHPHFLLLDEASRSWFGELRAATPLNATLLGRSPGCRLWRIDLDQRP